MDVWVPKDKHDLAAVQRLVGVPVERYRAQVPALLDWLGDINWLVAQALYPILQPLVYQISGEIVKCLQGRDHVQKYWLVQVFGIWSMHYPPDNICAEVERCAKRPTRGEEEEEVHLVARETMEYWRGKENQGRVQS